MKGYEDVALPFGKYKGTLLADVANSYLDWLLDQEFVEKKFAELHRVAVLEREYRKKFDIFIEG
jgi:uncharacterized protein (DUF3820 family)